MLASDEVVRGIINGAAVVEGVSNAGILDCEVPEFLRCPRCRCKQSDVGFSSDEPDGAFSYTVSMLVASRCAFDSVAVGRKAGDELS